MEIKIVNNGKAKGTVGWLRKQLESGTAKLEVKPLKHGYDGLFLVLSEDEQHLLAAYNLHNLSLSEYERANTWEPVWPRDRGNWYFSDAATSILTDIADKFCVEQNSKERAE